MPFFTKIDISACQIWLKLGFCSFEIIENSSNWIWDTLKCAIFQKFGVHILAGNFECGQNYKRLWLLKKTYLWGQNVRMLKVGVQLYS